MKGTNNLSVHAIKIERIKQEWSLSSIKEKEEKRVKSSSTIASILPKFKDLRPIGYSSDKHYVVPSRVYTEEDLSNIEFCFYCSSSGQDLLYCYDCGEAFHFFCAGLSLPPNDDIKKHWRCISCKLCQICNVQNPLQTEMIMCDNCDRASHPSCLTPRFNKNLHKYVCGRCVSCKYCKLPQVSFFFKNFGFRNYFSLFAHFSFRMPQVTVLKLILVSLALKRNLQFMVLKVIL